MSLGGRFDDFKVVIQQAGPHGIFYPILDPNYLYAIWVSSFS